MSHIALGHYAHETQRKQKKKKKKHYNLFRYNFDTRDTTETLKFKN